MSVTQVDIDPLVSVSYPSIFGEGLGVPIASPAPLSYFGQLSLDEYFPVDLGFGTETTGATIYSIKPSNNAIYAFGGVFGTASGAPVPFIPPSGVLFPGEGPSVEPKPLATEGIPYIVQGGTADGGASILIGDAQVNPFTLITWQVIDLNGVNQSSELSALSPSGTIWVKETGSNDWVVFNYNSMLIEDTTASGGSKTAAIASQNTIVSGIAALNVAGKRIELSLSDPTDNTALFTVTVAAKTETHPYYNQGSSQGYYLNGVQSPALTIEVGQTLKLDQSDPSNSGHPLRFYTDAEKTTEYTTGVTTNGTAGSSGAYTQIVADANTPTTLYYQCSNHAYMGHSLTKS